VRDVELGAVAAILADERDEILRRWLEAARAQPFHAAHPDGAVADHIPRLFDSLVDFLLRSAPRTVAPCPPLNDPGVHASARAHAHDRFQQGLGAADVLTEFRLLRQEIGRALREHVAGAADIVGAELLVNDTLDGASILGLAALDAHGAERRRSEAAERRYAQLLDQAHDAVFAWQWQGPIMYWNRGAEELYGYSRDEAVGRISHELLGSPPDEVAAVMAALERDGRWEGELQHRDRDGRAVYVDSRMVFLEEDNGPHVLESNRDVTGRRLAAAERAALLAVLAHDLKTPLTTIKGSADLLQRQATSGRLTAARVAERATSISAAAAGMAAQLDELLDAARLRSGRLLDLALRPTDLVALARRLAAQAQAATDRHTIDVDASVPELIGEWDVYRLERVLRNLLANAVKYSPAGGTITVRVAREEGPDGPWAFLSVQDRGMGIPAADLPCVFEPYRRGRNVSNEFPGEGIGLTGARQIVEQHGGTIAATSAEGAGSTFTIRLPLSS
jgi:PAS domain S-box-containing protein